jgi:hypothetical protein
MTSLAAIIRQYGAAYQAKYGTRLLPSHQRTLRDIANCRTATLGGHVYHLIANYHISHAKSQRAKNITLRVRRFLLV